MNRRTLLAVLAVFAFGFAMESSVEAGGVGNKPNAIYVVNQQFGGGELAQNVIWLPTGQTPANQGILSAVPFLAKGGRSLPPGGSVTFPNVAPGSGQVWLLNNAYVVQNGGVGAPYTVKSGTRLAYSVGGTNAAGTIVQVP